MWGTCMLSMRWGESRSRERSRRNRGLVDHARPPSDQHGDPLGVRVKTED